MISLCVFLGFMCRLLGITRIYMYIYIYNVCTEKSFLNLVELNQVLIVITLIPINLTQQTEFRLVHKSSILEKV